MLEALVGVIIVGGAVALFWSHLRSSAPTVAPLEISADDEEMIAARDRARQSVGEFIRLYSEHPEGAMIKVPFVSSTNVTEYLVASVVQLGEQRAVIRIESRPATHRGAFEPVQSIALDQIADWLVVLPNVRKRGGFTMQVQFKRRREMHGALPPELQAEEQSYDWEGT